MKLYTTLTTPYGRIVRVVMIEKGLADRIPVEVPETRVADSPYYAINPSGRVPYLLLDDGSGLEDSALISRYLDGLDGEPTLTPPPGDRGLPARRIEAMARSMLDGIGVWAREYLYRPPELRSAFITDHERARALRMTGVFEEMMEDPVLTGPLCMAQITLACALHGRDGRPPGFDWRGGCPRLAAWVDEIGQRPSIAETLPPT